MNEAVKIAWFGKHFGEEPVLTGSLFFDNNVEKQSGHVKSPNGDHATGAGTIFFTGCNLRCVFCQNYQISQQGIGKEYSIQELADIMIKLQNDGAVCIDLVTPTIWWKQIKEAITIAKDNGLRLPIVWNSNGYEQLEIIKEMKGLVDIYLPDFKYSDDELAFRYSGIKKYRDIARHAIQEMFDQVGLLQEENGIAIKGLIVRHLVLPHAIENSFGVLDDIANINTDVHVSLMNQYLPMHNAHEFPELSDVVSEEDFDRVHQYMLGKDFINGWVQGDKSQECLVPDFNRNNPFLFMF